jgi:hypothetical protein
LQLFTRGVGLLTPSSIAGVISEHYRDKVAPHPGWKRARFYRPLAQEWHDNSRASQQFGFFGGDFHLGLIGEKVGKFG